MNATRYVKKPIVVEAFCLDGGPMPDWFLDARSADVVQTFAEGTGSPFRLCGIACGSIHDER